MTFIRRHTLFSQFTAFSLGLVLALRLVMAPFIVTSPVPGVMAICSGGQIIYVSMSDGQPVEAPEGHEADPCPFFGIVNALAAAETRLTPPALIVSVVTDSLVIKTTPHVATERDNQSRAPPFFI